MQRSLFHLCFFISICAYSQVSTKLYVDGDLVKSKTFKDTVEVIQYVRNFKLQRFSLGYLFTGIDSIKREQDVWCIFIHEGKKTNSLVQGLGRKSLFFELKRRLKYHADHGYPFSSLSIDSLRMEDGDIKGILKMERGPFIQNDTAYFISNIQTRPKYIYQLLNHVPGEAFNESEYLKIDKKMERSSFLSFNRPADISFQNSKATLYLDVSEGKSGTFQGILGLQQQGSGEANVVGSFDLNVENLFKSGKQLTVAWERFGGSSQALNLAYKHPYILQSKLIPFFEFELLRQDSIFLKRETQLGIGAYIAPKMEVILSYEGGSGSLLTTEESLLENSDLADFESSSYSIKFRKGRFSDLDRLRSGLAWEVASSLGNKIIGRNVSLPNSFYDTLDLNTRIFRLESDVAISKKVSKRQVFFQQVEAGIIENDELLNNERYRLGGFTSLRGFDENVFFSDRYLLSRTELRSFFESGSYLFLFLDQLFYRSATFSDSPTGTGLGFSLATLSGQFNFALALGKSQTQSIDFSTMKAHFGFVSRF